MKVKSILWICFPALHSSRQYTRLWAIISILSFSMQYSHHPKCCMNGFSLNFKGVTPPDIIEESRVGQPAYRWYMQFHLNAADTGQFSRKNTPFCPFAVAFQEIAPPGHLYDAAKGERLGYHSVIIPADMFWSAATKCTLYHTDWYTVSEDVLPEQGSCYRFYGNDMGGKPGCTDAESTYIRPDIDHPVRRVYVIEPVFRNVKDLPERSFPVMKNHLV